MAQVTLSIGGRGYDFACRDGEETHLLALGDIIHARVAEAGRAVGGGNEARQLVMAALMLADELSELRAGDADPEQARTAAAIATLADRLELLAARLEKDGDAS